MSYEVEKFKPSIRETYDNTPHADDSPEAIRLFRFHRCRSDLGLAVALRLFGSEEHQRLNSKPRIAMHLTDTPRTNEAITVIFDRDGSLGEHNAPESLVVLARKLERENTEMRRVLGIAAKRFRHESVEWEDAAEDCEKWGLPAP